MAFASGFDAELVLVAHAAAAEALALTEPVRLAPRAKVASLTLLKQESGAVVQVRCGALDMSVEPRTAAAMSLLQLTQLVPGNAKYAEGLARCVARLPDIHARVRRSATPRSRPCDDPRCRAGSHGGECRGPVPSH